MVVAGPAVKGPGRPQGQGVIARRALKNHVVKQIGPLPDRAVVKFHRLYPIAILGVVTPPDGQGLPGLFDHHQHVVIAAGPPDEAKLHLLRGHPR